MGESAAGTAELCYLNGVNYPLLFAIGCFVLLWGATLAGDWVRRKSAAITDDRRADSSLLLTATLTLLFFIIGFSFSMAVNRYDLRKASEQAEATAITTAYSRADLLPPQDATTVHGLLKQYLAQRLLYYTTRSGSGQGDIATQTIRLQNDLWSTVRPALPAIPPPLMGLLVTGINDVVTSQRNAQAAWLNRIPLSAWILMIVLGMTCCGLIGARARQTDRVAFLVVPVAVAVSLFLMADLDSPVGGAIRVNPDNLANLLRLLTP